MPVGTSIAYRQFKHACWMRLIPRYSGDGDEALSSDMLSNSVLTHTQGQACEVYRAGGPICAHKTGDEFCSEIYGKGRVDTIDLGCHTELDARVS